MTRLLKMLRDAETKTFFWDEIAEIAEKEIRYETEGDDEFAEDVAALAEFLTGADNVQPYSILSGLLGSMLYGAYRAGAVAAATKMGRDPGGDRLCDVRARFFVELIDWHDFRKNPPQP